MAIPLTVREANAAIREAYRQGCELLDQLGERSEYGSMERVAGQWGISPEKIRKLRQFAERYSPQQLEDLLALCERYDRPLGVSFLYKLVTVPTRQQQRYRLQVAMLRDGWSRGELDRQILARFGRRANAGKRRTIPGDALGLVAQIESQCHGWVRWDQDLRQGLPDRDDESLAALISQLKQVTRSVTRLQSTAAELLSLLRDESATE